MVCKLHVIRDYMPHFRMHENLNFLKPFAGLIWKQYKILHSLIHTKYINKEQWGLLLSSNPSKYALIVLVITQSHLANFRKNVLSAKSCITPCCTITRRKNLPIQNNLCTMNLLFAIQNMMIREQEQIIKPFLLTLHHFNLSSSTIHRIRCICIARQVTSHLEKCCFTQHWLKYSVLKGLSWLWELSSIRAPSHPSY